MKIPFKELALLAGMVLSAFGIFKAVDHFAPSDIDLMADTSGALVYQAPFQKVIPDTLFTFEAGGARLVPQALFDVTGVVLGKKRYLPWGDYHMAPWDLGIGWSDMSDPTLLADVSFWQRNRFMHFRYGAGASVNKYRIIPNSANIHIIPANDEVKRKMSEVRKGNVVRLTGFLVNVTDGDTTLKPSLERGDTGAGACEILYVQAIDLDPIS
jgi:hypothetical protein